MFGMNFLGPLGLATLGDGRPDNTSGDTSALSKLYAAVRASNHTPNGRVARGWDQFGPQAPQIAQHPSVPALGGLGLFPPAAPMAASPLQTAVATPSPLPSVPQAPGALSSAAASPPAASAPAPVTTPMPTPRPVDAPAASPVPDMGFFARNAAMMRDQSGDFLDPTAGSNAQATGPDVINKLMSYFHKKDDPTG